MTTPTGYGLREYRAFAPHPLEGWEPALGAEVVSAITAADRALASAASVPRTELGGAIASWMAARDESIRSSAMEGVEATESGLAWALYMDEAGRPVSDENEVLTLGAAKQVAAAVELGERMGGGATCTLDDVLAIHRSLFAGTRDRDIGGVLRDGPIWIGPPGCTVDDASFVPPPPGFVADLLEDLVAYMNTSSHPPVLRAAVAHAQFETIHPFEDGNGRTGRALIHTVLNAAGTVRGAIPISVALDRNRGGYYDALNATRIVCSPGDGSARSAALGRWLGVFGDACEQAYAQAASLSQAVEALAGRWREAASFRRGSAAAVLLEALPSMPVLDAGLVAVRLGVTERAARSALASLAAAGIVAPVGGRRNRRYLVPEMVGVLRHATPDGGLASPIGIRAAPPIGRPPAEPPTVCGYRGPRSKIDCLLPMGHQGQHRYPSSR